MNEFSKLGLIEPILKSIEEEGFEKPTEIQSKSIPLALEGKDIIAGSATGSGKTLSFGAGIIQNSDNSNTIQALILTPTRELAEQIKKALKIFSKYKKLDIVEIYGGLSINPQIENLRKANIVVGTPGRILDHIGRNTIDLSKVSTLVLDEADRMFDMGFIEDVEKIIKRCPKERQTLLFSATINEHVSRIAKRYMKDPVKVSAVKQVDPKKLSQVYCDVDEKLKFSLLVHLLKHEQSKLVMVFCNSRRTVDFVANNLKSNDIQAQAIHGGLSQAKRNHVIETFHAKKLTVLVCTDVAARGLDIKGVSHVYNYDLPMESKQYVHRIGRTARAGKSGKVLNLLSRKDFDNFSKILRDFALEIPKEQTPKFERAKVTWKGTRGRGFGPRTGFNRGGPRRSFGNNRRR